MFARCLRAIEILVLVCFTLSLSAAAEREPSHFEQANRLYEEGKYTEAISLYEAMVRAGRNSPGVFFNLGNAYFKNGEMGRAIYNFRRAEVLAPRDPDIQANLRFARDRISGSAAVQIPLWRRYVGFFTLNELAVPAAVLFWLTLFGLGAVRYRPALAPVLRTCISIAMVLLVIAVVWITVAYINAQQQFAIAVQRQVVVHLGPLAESQAAYTVPDGTELQVEAQRENWYQVIDRSGRSGWVDSAQVYLFP